MLLLLDCSHRGTFVEVGDKLIYLCLNPIFHWVGLHWAPLTSKQYSVAADLAGLFSSSANTLLNFMWVDCEYCISHKWVLVLKKNRAEHDCFCTSYFCAGRLFCVESSLFIQSWSLGHLISVLEKCSCTKMMCKVLHSCWSFFCCYCSPRELWDTLDCDPICNDMQKWICQEKCFLLQFFPFVCLS